MTGDTIESGRSVTSKVSAILQAFAEGTEHSMVEIARLTGLPISTAHRLMTELTSRRFLERMSNGRYRVGLALRMIGAGEASPPRITEFGPGILEDVSACMRSCPDWGCFKTSTTSILKGWQARCRRRPFPVGRRCPPTRPRWAWLCSPSHPTIR